MATNYYTYFYGDDNIDVCDQTAQTIFEILAAPGYFQLELGISDEDLELEDPAKEKIKKWLKSEVKNYA